MVGLWWMKLLKLTLCPGKCGVDELRLGLGKCGVDELGLGPGKCGWFVVDEIIVLRLS